MSRTLALALIGAFAVTGCASHDHQDRFLLGTASDQNAAAQSVRDVREPNIRPVVHGAGAGLGEANQPTPEPMDDER